MVALYAPGFVLQTVQLFYVAPFPVLPVWLHQVHGGLLESECSKPCRTTCERFRDVLYEGKLCQHKHCSMEFRYIRAGLIMVFNISKDEIDHHIWFLPSSTSTFVERARLRDTLRRTHQATASARSGASWRPDEGLRNHDQDKPGPLSGPRWRKDWVRASSEFAHCHVTFRSHPQNAVVLSILCSFA